ncbi:hypothetical protein AAVH_18662 [Aphelenchoides avenae]|nr:hypothetical protein AAVH_18662 [Aphelenchus avenae]
MAAAVEDNVQDVEENVEEHVVSAIRAAKFVDGVLMFAVEWEGFDVGMGTYEPVQHCLTADESIASFFESLFGLL